MRVAYFIALAVCFFAVLAGCQTKPTVNKVMDTYKILQSKKDSQSVYLTCAASIDCHFARVDDILILDEKAKRPTAEAIKQGLIRLEGSLLSAQQKYALSLAGGEHEVVVRFYPVSAERAEHFHIIHNFRTGHLYKMQMYRQKSSVSGSLMQVAAPGELCVDLLQDETVIRRFCRPYNAMTGLGEFVEKSI